MEIGKIKNSAQKFFEKYKFVILILLIGFVLLLLPSETFKNQPENHSDSLSLEVADSEEQLEKIISLIKGAGKVRVMLTQKTGFQTIYQSDDDITSGGENTSTRSSTVVITDSQRNQIGLVKQKNPPQYLGAVVVCQGADSAKVKLAVIDAVSKLTGLGADSICVIKMK